MSKGTSGSRSPVQSNYGDGHDNDAYNDEYVDENDKKNYDVADYDDGVLVPDDDDVSDDADDDDDGGDGDLVPEQPFLPDLKQQPSIKVTDFTEMIFS